MTHYYYIKIPLLSSSNAHVDISKYATAITGSFPPEDAVMYVEVSDTSGLTGRFKKYMAGFQVGDVLDVPDATMLTKDVEEFVHVQRQLETVGVKLNVLGS